jgi:hypothetical protein
MDTSTSRYDGGDGRSLQVIYWRRRFLALVGGLAVLALLAWASSGMFDGVGGLVAAAGSGPQAHAASNRVGTAANGSGGRNAAGGTGTGAARGSGRGSRRPGASGAPGRRDGRGAGAAVGRRKGHGSGADGGKGKGGTSGAGHRGGTGRKGGTGRGSSPRARRARTAKTARTRACPARDVVLSLFATQRRYGLGEVPEFDVDVVSTAARSCTFDVGPRFLALVIKSGAISVWDSADCVAGPGSLITELVRGVPTVLPMSWDRARSSPGCTSMSSPAPDGRYVAIATDGSHHSNTQTFRLAIYR